jgi:hypothetical protein
LPCRAVINAVLPAASPGCQQVRMPSRLPVGSAGAP